MKREVIIVFDVGKTNKKVLLFDRYLNVVHEEEERFKEVTDDDGFPSEDIEGLEQWIDRLIERFLHSDRYEVKGINFTSYGASLVYLDERGDRFTPLYNYLKPLPENLLCGFYERYGGEDEFCRSTASPALGMLNSGLQILWLKRSKPETFAKVSQILHLPQYLSYRITKKIRSEYTSLGCHTALWDFENMDYHRWLKDEGITLPGPGDSGEVVPVRMNGRRVIVGVGIHDSSASLVPYLISAADPFILVSTGTWCITMNPYNHSPLTVEELKRDCLCFLSVKRKPVKSSRFFLGYIHDQNVAKLESYFKVSPGYCKGLIPGHGEIPDLWAGGKGSCLFFKEGAPPDFTDRKVNLEQFSNIDEAYARLMLDLTRLAIRSIRLTVTSGDSTNRLFITGGFAKNRFFTGFLTCAFPGRKIYTSAVNNATSLGAALVIARNVWCDAPLKIDLELTESATS